jgi:hypothetical protein
MRATFVHTAELIMAADADERAPGAAITLALCGSWEHPPPCPLAAHHTAARRAAGPGAAVRLRVLFAAEPQDEPGVRGQIVAALGAGELRGPDGGLTRWRLAAEGPDVVAAEESAHAARLANG